MGLLKLPGLIDPHVHLRDPGQTNKEDFYTGTSAALAGGYTTVLDMPNNESPTTSLERLEKKSKIAKGKIVCDVGFYFGSLGDNIGEFKKVKNRVYGLKLYLNQTTGNFLIDPGFLEKVFSFWPGLILVHAEGKTVEDVLEVVKKTKKATHFCHISLQSELKLLHKAKEQGLPVTCGVTPHHLFLTDKDERRLGPFAKMRPPLRSKNDVTFLWKNLDLIDIIESDHAPHTLNEKQGSNPPSGVPGLETTLPLLLTAVATGRITIEDVIRLCSQNPARIFHIKQSSNTIIDIDFKKSYIIEKANLKTKCGWSPFEGKKVKGKVIRVFIRGKKVYDDGQVLVKPGFGKIIK